MREDSWTLDVTAEALIDHITQQHTGKAPTHLSLRKLRLFTVACCRRIWNVLPSEQCRSAVQVSERFADDEATFDELRAACRSAKSHRNDFDDYGHYASGAAAYAAEQDIVSNAFPVTVCAHRAVSLKAGDREVEEFAQANLMRDIFGNPFRPVSVDTSWCTPTVIALAEGIYQERAFDRMPILADALEDTGCDNADILSHCRQSGEHVRGCWVVDVLTGRT